MAIFHSRLESRTKAGQQADPSVGLLAAGLRIPMLVGVHPGFEATLVSAGKTVPAPVQGIALVDTGATITSIDLEVAQRLGLQPTGSKKLGTAGGQHNAPTFAFSFSLPSFPRLSTSQGVGCDLRGQNIIALIGMDLLRRCVMVLNGPDGSFLLAH